MARPKEKEVVMTKQGKRTYRLDKKTGKKLTWRPNKFTPEVVAKLEEQFSWNSSVKTACAMAGVSPDAYYDECNRNPEFRQKMQRAQEYVSSLADRVIAKAIKDGDSSTAKRFKERIDERYKKENTIKMSANSETDPETGEVVTWLEVEFELTD